MTEETAGISGQAIIAPPPNIHAQELGRRKKGLALKLTDAERMRRSLQLAHARAQRWKRSTKRLCQKLNEDSVVI